MYETFCFRFTQSNWILGGNLKTSLISMSLFLGAQQHLLLTGLAIRSMSVMPLVKKLMSWS